MLLIDKRLRKFISYYEEEPYVRSLVRKMGWKGNNLPISKLIKNLDFKYNDLCFNSDGAGPLGWFAAALLYNQKFHGQGIREYEIFYEAGQKIGLCGLVSKLMKQKDVLNFKEFESFECFWVSDLDRKDLFSNYDSLEESYIKNYRLKTFFRGLKGEHQEKRWFASYTNYLIYLAGYDLFLEHRENG